MTSETTRRADIRITIDKGLRFPQCGASLPIMTPTVRSIAVHGGDYPGLRAEILVQRGDHVEGGQVLFRDRKQPEIQVVSPASGVVSEIRIGPRRALHAIVVDLNGPPERSVRLSEPAGGIGKIAKLPLDELRQRMQTAGLWTAIRQRPGDRVPPADGMADAVLITAIDTDPYSPLPEAVLEGQWDEFRAGVIALSRFSKSTTLVCTGPEFPYPGEDEEYGISVATFDGPHPAGLPGTHINRLAPLRPGRSAWHVGYQDVAAIGHLLLNGRLKLTRIIGLDGPGVEQAALLRVPLGACVVDLTADVARDRPLYARDIISGSLLSGRRAEPPYEHLGRFHRQVTVTANPQPGRKVPRLLAKMLADSPPSLMPRALAGGMLPLDRLDRLWALDGPPAPLLRALMTGDLDAAVALGCLDLGEEDLALLSLACTSGLDYGAGLRDALDTFDREYSR